MDDPRIVELYWARDEQALTESERKYGRMLFSVSYRLVGSRQDAEECVNDTYLKTWNSIPDARPEHLGAFMARITRGLSIDRFRQNHRIKRGEGVGTLEEELAECLPDPSVRTPAQEYDDGRLRDALNRFLETLPPEQRRMFVGRYFFSRSCRELSAESGLSVANVKVRLHRLRESLRKVLEQEELL